MFVGYAGSNSFTGAFVMFSGVLKRTAIKLSKIANDLRLLSSGPRAGFGEINLPAVQAGSSIMPGKVNPVIPEVVNQAAYLVVGYDVTISMCAEGGQLQLNAFEPTIGFAIAQGQRLLTNAANILRDLKNEPRKDFKYFDKGSMATIGRNKAIVQLGKFKLTGFIAWLAWLFVHVISLIGFKNRLYVLSEWFWAYLTRERSARLITGDADELENALNFLEAKPAINALIEKPEKIKKTVKKKSRQ